MTDWKAEQLRELDAVPELRIAGPRRDGSWPPLVPIWVVTVDGEVYVRTWHRRDTGWYGRAARSRSARIQLGDNDMDVVVEAIGAEPERLVGQVDAAYRSKYARPGDETVSGMVSEEAAASTLRLRPAASTR